MTTLPNSEQSSKGKVKTHKYINRQINQQPENCENRNDPDLVQDVYISQLIRYARASSNYSDFLKHHLYLRNRLLDQVITRIALFELLEKLYSDTKILSKYIPSLQRR
jgi:hypothetical protein